MNSHEFSIEPGVNDTGLNEHLNKETKFNINQISELLKKYDEVIQEHIETLENTYKIISTDQRLDGDE